MLEVLTCEKESCLRRTDETQGVNCELQAEYVITGSLSLKVAKEGYTGLIQTHPLLFLPQTDLYIPEM